MDSPEFSLQIIEKTFWWVRRKITWVPLKSLQFSALTKQPKKPFSHAHFIFSLFLPQPNKSLKNKGGIPLKLRDLA